MAGKKRTRRCNNPAFRNVKGNWIAVPKEEQGKARGKVKNEQSQQKKGMAKVHHKLDRRKH